MNNPALSQLFPYSFYQAAAERTLRQFIEAFWFEDVLQGWLEQLEDGQRILRVCGQDMRAVRVEYVIAALPRRGFKRDRLSGAVMDAQSGQAVYDIARVAGDLLRALDLPTTSQFVKELSHTATNEAYSMQAEASRSKQEDVLQLAYAWQEAQLGTGHLYHPCFRSRMGFSVFDHQRYGPEFVRAFALVWLAMDASLVEVHSLLATEYGAFLQAEIGEQEYQRLQQAIRDQGLDAQAYCLLPVHPWHWLQCVQIQFADCLADGRLLYLGVGKTKWLAQQSIRSLSALADPTAHHIKLPLAIANSSADRILSDHHVQNAPLISRCLQSLVASDAYLQQHDKLVILSEPIGITLRADLARPDRYGLLGAIWRQAPEHYLHEGEQAFPCTALNVVDSEGQLVIAPWLARHGIQTWVRAFLHTILPPCLHLMLAHGVLLEVHAQNTVLLHRDGLPCRIAMRDLPGGLHYIAGHSTVEAALQDLRCAPAYRNRLNASNGFAMESREEARDYLLEVLLFIHLSEFAYRLELHHDFPEQQFWQLVVEAVLAYQSSVPALQDVIAQFDLFVPHIRVEKLASRRLSVATSQEFHRVPNPLFEHRQLGQ